MHGSGDVIPGYLPLTCKLFLPHEDVNFCGIDRLRLDKFYLFIRFFLKETFNFLCAILTDHKNFCHSLRLVLGQLYILSREGKEM